MSPFCPSPPYAKCPVRAWLGIRRSRAMSWRVRPAGLPLVANSCEYSFCFGEHFRRFVEILFHAHQSTVWAPGAARIRGCVAFLQFRLRTLFVLLTLAGLACA